MNGSELKIRWKKKLARWNSSYYINIPIEIARALPTDEVLLYIENGKIVLEPVSRTDSDLPL